MVGVGIGPPNVLDAPKPTSSVRIRSTLGAPFGACTPAGKSGLDSLTVRPIVPLKGGSGLGRTSCAEARFASANDTWREQMIHLMALACCLSRRDASPPPLPREERRSRGLTPGPLPDHPPRYRQDCTENAPPHRSVPGGSGPPAEAERALRCARTPGSVSLAPVATGVPPSLLHPLPLDAFIALPPAERAAAARNAVSDLNVFLDDGRAREQRRAPRRTRELALGLAGALRREAKDDAAAPTRDARIVTDAFLRSECDRDQNVYLGRLFTRVLTRAVPDLIFQPVSAAEISTALRWARSAHVPVTLRGAASTAMGGAVPADAGLVLDLSRLDRIDVDETALTVRIGAGVR